MPTALHDVTALSRPARSGRVPNRSALGQALRGKHRRRSHDGTRGHRTGKKRCKFLAHEISKVPDMERKVGKDAGSTALRRLPYGRWIPENITLVTKFIFVEISFPWKRSLHGIAWARRARLASGPCPHAWMQHGSRVQGLRSTWASPRQAPPACSSQDTRGGPSWGTA